MNPAQVKHLLPLLIAFADGKQLEFRINGWNWQPCGDSPDIEADGRAVEYRIKPEPVIVHYRNYLAKHGDRFEVYATTNKREIDNGVGPPSYFVRWIDTEWQEVEV